MYALIQKLQVNLQTLLMRFSGLALYLRGSEESKTNVKEKCYVDLEIKIKEFHCHLFNYHKPYLSHHWMLF